MKKYGATIFLSVLLVVLSLASLFIGVIDVKISYLLNADSFQWQVFLASRLPRLLAILCTGAGMSIAGLIMQQLCMNKFISPTTGATISSEFFSPCFLCRIPLFGDEHFLLLLSHSWEHGFLCCSFSIFSLRM